MILDGGANQFDFDGQPVGKVTQIEVLDGIVADIPHPSLGQTQGKEYLPGVPDFGMVTLRFYRDTDDPGQEAMAQGVRTRQVAPCSITLQDGRVINFKGYAKVVPITGLIDNVNTSRCIVKITGPVS